MKKDWSELYREFEEKYNDCPVQMSRAEAFSKAKVDGLITDEEYTEARRYYGDLWFYTGD
jgi:hypothetical protein